LHIPLKTPATTPGEPIVGSRRGLLRTPAGEPKRARRRLRRPGLGLEIPGPQPPSSENLMNAEPKRHRRDPGNEKMTAATRDRLIMEHAPLIKYIVNRIAQRLPSHVDLDDLMNTGVIGLMDAIEKYNPEKNCKFKTYAEFRIKGAILDQLRSLDWVPRSVRQKSRRLEAAYNQMEQKLGRAASDEEVAHELGVEIRKFHELLNQVRGISLVNLDEVRSASDLEKKNLIDVLEDTSGDDPLTSLNFDEMKKTVAEAIGNLPEKERLVISLYYYDELNMKEIGKILDITESRVCQIHTKAVLRLRAKLKSAFDK
jgi:RNA polymerase sigma factor for flagellar operon FliA